MARDNSCLVVIAMAADTQTDRMGLILSGMNLGALIAPFVAGAVYEHAGYYAVFCVVLGVLVFDSVLRLAMIEKRTAAKWLEKPSGVSDEEAVLPPNPSTAYHEGNGQEYRRVQPEVNGQPLLSSLIGDETSPLLAKDDQRSTSWFQRTFPTMSILLGSPRLMTAVYGVFTHTTLIASFDAILPQFVKRTFGWTSTGAGLIFLAITIPSLLGPVVGALSDRYGTKKISLVGFATTIPFLALLGVVNGPELAYQVLLVVLLVITSQCPPSSSKP